MNEIKKLLKKEYVIFEFFGKEQIGEELTNKQWDKFVKTYNDKFANGSYEVAKECIREFMEHEDIKWI